MGKKRKVEMEIKKRKRKKLENAALDASKKNIALRKPDRKNGSRTNQHLKDDINNASLHGKSVLLTKSKVICGSHQEMNQNNESDLDHNQVRADKSCHLECAKKKTETVEKCTTKLKARHKRKRKMKKKDSCENKKLSEKNVQGSEIDKIHLPTKVDEYSANWKQLMQTLESTKKKTSKVKQNPTRVKLFKQSQKNDDKKVVTVEKRPTHDIWFDDVDDILLEDSRHKDKPVTVGNTTTSNPLVKPESFEGLTKVIAMDCEMVGIGSDGKDNMLARASIVNQYGQCVYDKYVKPREEVTDYRTAVSGIRQTDLISAEEFSTVQRDISNIFKGRILVGHAIHNDLQVLYLDHPRKNIRDTQQYKPFRKLFQGRLPSLKKLTEKVLNVAVQEGEHNSVQDAQATMRLYTMYRKRWEKEIREKLPHGISKVKKARKKAKSK